MTCRHRSLLRTRESWRCWNSVLPSWKPQYPEEVKPAPAIPPVDDQPKCGLMPSPQPSPTGLRVPRKQHDEV
ncbi:hypothetical protein KIF59_16310 [Enterobacter cloacae subsp. cloacae]|nr:hypothetical protein [Enterobacter cloacae subsp. cloacae]